MLEASLIGLSQMSWNVGPCLLQGVSSAVLAVLALLTLEQARQIRSGDLLANHGFEMGI